MMCVSLSWFLMTEERLFRWLEGKQGKGQELEAAEAEHTLNRLNRVKFSNDTLKHSQTWPSTARICSILVERQICTLVSPLQEIKAPICKILKLTAVIKYSPAHLHQRETQCFLAGYWNTKISFYALSFQLLAREP